MWSPGHNTPPGILLGRLILELVLGVEGGRSCSSPEEVVEGGLQRKPEGEEDGGGCGQSRRGVTVSRTASSQALLCGSLGLLCSHQAREAAVVLGARPPALCRGCVSVDGCGDGGDPILCFPSLFTGGEV